MGEGTLRSGQPEVYAKLLSEHFDKPAIVEARATCASCEMCDKGNMPSGVSAVYFRPDLKCCTYHPSLPNYLVGAILADDRPDMQAGKRRIQKEIATRIGVTPEWLGPPRKWELLYEASWRATFGRSTFLRCPYLTDDNLCSVWRHRETVCSTFYCKFVGGAQSSAFWKATKAYFCFVEQQLATFAAKTVSNGEVSEPDVAKDTLTLHELEGKPLSDADYEKFWRSWVGREEEYYVACFRAIGSLDRAKFDELVDRTPRGRELLSTLVTRYAAIGSQKIPDRIALNPKLRKLPVANGVVVTTPYNPYDSFCMESELHEVLEQFKHEETLEEARERLAKEMGVEFDDALLRELALHEIIVGPKPGWQHGKCEPLTQATLVGRRMPAKK